MGFTPSIPQAPVLPTRHVKYILVKLAARYVDSLSLKHPLHTAWSPCQDKKDVAIAITAHSAAPILAAVACVSNVELSTRPCESAGSSSGEEFVGGVTPWGTLGLLAVGCAFTVGNGGGDTRVFSGEVSFRKEREKRCRSRQKKSVVGVDNTTTASTTNNTKKTPLKQTLPHRHHHTVTPSQDAPSFAPTPSRWQPQREPTLQHPRRQGPQSFQRPLRRGTQQRRLTLERIEAFPCPRTLGRGRRSC